MGQANYARGFEVTLHEHALELPLRLKTPQLIFVNSMRRLPWAAHIWMGVTVENAECAGRIDDLREAGGAGKFLSFGSVHCQVTPSLILPPRRGRCCGDDFGRGVRPRRPPDARGLGRGAASARSAPGGCCRGGRGMRCRGLVGQRRLKLSRSGPQIRTVECRLLRAPERLGREASSWICLWCESGRRKRMVILRSRFPDRR